MTDEQSTAQARSFGAAASVYAAVRPGYPDDAVAWLVGDADRVLDLGAGTGKLTEALVRLDRDVVAVDPIEEMLEELSLAVPGVPRLVGTAEAIPLDDADVDAVVVGQAWHWFDRRRASTEIARVLRPGGHLGVIWNTRDTDVDWVARAGAVMHEGLAANPEREMVDLGSEFGPAETLEARWTSLVTRDGFAGLVRSRSYFITASRADQQATLAALARLLDEHPDTAGRDVLELPYVTRAFRTAVR